LSSLLFAPLSCALFVTGVRMLKYLIKFVWWFGVKLTLIENQIFGLFPVTVDQNGHLKTNFLLVVFSVCLMTFKLLALPLFIYQHFIKQKMANVSHTMFNSAFNGMCITYTLAILVYICYILHRSHLVATLNEGIRLFDTLSHQLVKGHNNNNVWQFGIMVVVKVLLLIINSIASLESKVNPLFEFLIYLQESESRTVIFNYVFVVLAIKYQLDMLGRLFQDRFMESRQWANRL
jgi:hypothetical protein